MKYLKDVAYQESHGTLDKTYKSRLLTESSIQFDLYIKPINQPTEYELYYVPTNNMIQKVSEIYKVSSELNMIFNKIPSVAKDQFITECLIDELFNTNQLEGVRSTREEIAESVRDIKSNKNNKRRFTSMAKSYFQLLSDDFSLPATPQDIRSIYDNITAREIEDDELPDGNIFRKDITYIYNQSGTGKIIHQGILPEDKIVREVGKMLRFLRDNDDIPMIIKAAVSHYFFGYIHPFYDGNGRTSRFITSLYLSKELGNISALSVSRGCNKNKKDYLKAFEVSNSIRTRGEMNFFIDVFLGVILNALEEMLLILKEKHELLDIAYEKINQDDRLVNDIEKDFMFILAQNQFFTFDQGLDVKSLSESLEVSQVTTRRIAKELLEKSLIQSRGKRPVYYSITQEYFES